jgi:hypothetical protein
MIACLGINFSANAQLKTDIQNLLDKATMATDMGYYDKAIDYYQQALKIKPDLAEVYREIGNLYVMKGQSQEFVREAVLNFTKYLQARPKAADAEQVRTSINKLEFVFEIEQEKQFEATQKQQAKELLVGRWASTLTTVDDSIYQRSLFIFDISHIGDKFKIDIEPSSLAYRSDFTAKTVYVDDTCERFFITFTNDNNYVPSPEKYDNARMGGDLVARGVEELVGGIGGSFIGGAASWLIQSGINSAQGADKAKRIISTYEFVFETIPFKQNGITTIKCINRSYIREITPTSDKVLSDNMFESEFHKVKNDFINYTILKKVMGGVGVNTIGMGGKNDHYAIKGNANCRRMLLNYEDRKIAKDHRTARWLFWTGFIGLFESTFAAIVCESLSFDDDNFDSETRQIFKNVFYVGITCTAISTTMMIIGNKLCKKAVKKYNEREAEKHKKNYAEWNVGFTGNGIGLSLRF